MPQLTRWGASPEADLIFRALTEFGPQSLADVSRSLGLSQSRTRAALDELADIGAARQAPRQTGGRRSADDQVWHCGVVDDVVATLRRRRQERARIRLYARTYLSTLAELGAQCQVGPGEMDMVRPIHGLARVRSRLAELSVTERHEHLAMQPEPAYPAEAVRTAAPVNRAMLSHGVSMLTLGVPSVGDDTSAAHTLELIGNGMQYRELPTLPTKLMIMDRRTAVLPLDPEHTARGALEISAPSAVHGLVSLFLRRWEQGQPPRLVELASTMELSPREQAIIALLAAGHTDSSASAQLGLSVRTIAYTVRGLMDRYGVQNRFQLGLVLGSANRTGTGAAPVTQDGSPPNIDKEQE